MLATNLLSAVTLTHPLQYATNLVIKHFGSIISTNTYNLLSKKYNNLNVQLHNYHVQFPKIYLDITEDYFKRFRSLSQLILRTISK